MAKQVKNSQVDKNQTEAFPAASDNLAFLALGVADNPQTDTAPANVLAQDPELVQEFLIEAREHLSRIEALMIEIENGTSNTEPVHGVFRSFHTIKGLAGFLGYEAIQKLAHEVETLLDLARNSTIALTPEGVDVVLQAGDAIGAWLNYIAEPSSGQPPGHSALVDRIKSAMQDGCAFQAADADGRETHPSPPESVARRGLAEVTKMEAATVKVATSKLEYLVDMVGELVIAQSMLKHNPDLAALRTPRLQRDVAQLSRVTAEVQKTAMAMRMVPVGQLFRKMNRLVRDLARKSGKKVELELVGEDVELDRTLVEELADPLVHMIRNSMDHGVEPPDEREAAGKPPVGKLRLSAAHQAGQIAVEVADDGRGLDKRRILDKAVAKGVVAPGASLSDQEIYHLIFQPGFSTAEKVTDVSGRGLGMDVVRKQVEKLRGRIEVESHSGLGSRFLLKLPLTLAIIEGLVVRAGGERYIVPIFSVREMLRPTQDSIFTVEGKGEMAMVRDRLVPVARLTRKLGLPDNQRHSGDGLMIVGESEGREFCLMVDEMIGKQEVVIKSLGPAFRHVRGISGGAILGDGRVGLILDVAVLLQQSGTRAA
jgi:two-component system chemotaxis sensor kinase CheA